jgi:hypothetical protein
MTVYYSVQIGEAKSTYEARVQSWTLELITFTIIFSGFDRNLLKIYLNIIVRYSVQNDEARSICEVHIQSWTLKLEK